MLSEDRTLRRLLILGAETPALQRVMPILQRADFEVHHAGRGGEVLDLVGTVAFDLIVARFPIAGLALDDVVKAIRVGGGPCETAGLLLLAEPEHVKEVGGFLGHGINRIVSLDSPVDRLLDAIADLLAIAPRRTLRAVIQLELWVEHDRTRVLTVTENLSPSGMLVRGGRQFPLGSRLRFELVIPGEVRPIQGEVEVARHTDHLRERLDGFGGRILSFFGGDQERLEEFLKRKG